MIGPLLPPGFITFSLIMVVIIQYLTRKGPRP